MILISDLWDAIPERVMRASKHFRHRQHEVVVFHLLDPARGAVRLPRRDDLHRHGDRSSGLSDPALGDPQGVPAERLEERVEFYKRECGANLIAYERVLTDTPFDVALLRYLEKRSRLH